MKARITSRFLTKNLNFAPFIRYYGNECAGVYAIKGLNFNRLRLTGSKLPLLPHEMPDVPDMLCKLNITVHRTHACAARENIQNCRVMPYRKL